MLVNADQQIRQSIIEASECLLPLLTELIWDVCDDLVNGLNGLRLAVLYFLGRIVRNTLSSIGLPGLNGFVGEFLVLLGSFRANSTFAVIAASGVILSAVYMLWMYQRVVFGEITDSRNRKLVDLDIREKVILVPIVLMIFWIGIGSGPFLRTMDSSVGRILQQFQIHSLFVSK